MRSLRYSAALAAIMLLGACQAEKQPLNQEEEPQVIKKKVVLSAYSSDDSGTKSSRDANGTFYWSPGDEISVFYGSGDKGGYRFTSTCTETATIADFEGEMEEEKEEDHEYWAIYPYNALNAWNESTQTLTTEIPSHQVAAEGTFTDGQFISIGHSSTPSIGFYHLCGGIKFFLSVEGITRITLQGKGKPLAGLVEVKMDGDDHPYVSNIREPKNEIVLTSPSGVFNTGTDYFFVTMPVTFDGGFDVILEKGGTKQVGARLISSSMTIHRAKFQWSTAAIDSGVSFATWEEPDIVKTNVRAYLDNVDYSQNCGDPDTEGGYSYSVFKAPYSPVYSFSSGDDQPKAVTISWNKKDSADKVYISTSPSYSDNSLEISVSNKTSTDVYNLIPGVVYYYKVTSGNTIKKSGCFKPKGTLRQVYVAGNTTGSTGIARNFRDMGGWKAGDKTIRYGRLYRGAKIEKSGVTTAAKNTFQNPGIGNLGIGMDLEMRGGKSDDDSKETYYNNRPFPEIAWDYFPAIKFLGVVENNPGYTAEIYRDAIKRIISFLQEDRGAIYFHCEGGADRTGTLAFLIEAILGVSESDMSKDYELTTFRSSSMNVDSYQRYRHIELDRPDLGYSAYELKYPFRDFIRHLRTFEGSTMQHKVTNWAKTGENALTDAEIELLKALLLE